MQTVHRRQFKRRWKFEGAAVGHFGRFDSEQSWMVSECCVLQGGGLVRFFRKIDVTAGHGKE